MSYGRRYYSKDPRWIEARYPGRCAECGGTIARGAKAYYYPNGKTLYCERCGDGQSRDFDAAAFDEDCAVNRSL